ncbi:MAG: hypothetical protein GY805_16270 [Chloroflexi bacterium]|nr:hypothetical protein [Chloroflexota bacterium]
MSFEWRKDEDEGWPDEIPSGNTVVSKASWQSYWKLGLFLLLGIVAVWGVVQWQIKERITAATGSVESEIVATHNFVLQTAVSQDIQLFRGTLSGRDPDWADVQKTLLQEELLLQRPMFGWQHIEQAPLTSADVSVQLSPDLRAAELLFPQTFVVQTSTGVTKTITLQQTAVYRQGNTRWLFAPPLDEFWGDWVTNNGKHLTLVYPARDAEVAERLALDLDRLLRQMCTEMDDLNCSDELNLHLRLDREPDALLAANDIKTMLMSGLRLNLPTPTLIGTPTNEAGYEAVYRAYGVQVATAVLAHQIKYDCCRHQLFFRALRDYQLAELGLQVWPLNEVAYSSILSQGFDGNGSSHWTRRWEEAPPQVLQVYQVQEFEPIWQQVYLLVEYLAMRETAVSPTEMMRLMEKNSYYGWLEDVLSGSYDQNLFATRVLEFSFAQNQANQQEEPPIPLPAGTITLVCDNSSNNMNNGAYQYNLATGQWAERIAPISGGNNNISISPSNGERFLITDYQFNNDETSFTTTLLTEDGGLLLEETQILQSADQPQSWINYYFADMVGNFIVRAVYEDEDGLTQTSVRATDCPTSDCPEIQLPGWPFFSPDSKYLLSVGYPEGIVETGDGRFLSDLLVDISVISLDSQMSMFVGQGGRPFWLNDSTFGYLRVENGMMELVTAVLPQNEPRILLDETALLSAMPPADRPETLYPGFIVANPQNPQELLLSMKSSPGYGLNIPGLVFQIFLTADLTSVEKIELLQLDPFASNAVYSPNGRYILLVDYSQNSHESTWHLFDRETEQTIGPISTISYNLNWSPDGEWFVQSSKNLLLLQAPDHNYQHLIPHSLGSCLQVILSDGGK